MDLELLQTAEFSLVGRCILDPAYTDDIGLEPAMFQDIRLATMYGNILHLWRTTSAVGPVELADRCSKEYARESKWLELIEQACVEPCNTNIVESQAELIRQQYMRRSVARTCSDGAEQALVADDVSEVVESTIGKLEHTTELGKTTRPTLHDEIRSEIAQIAAGEDFLAGLPSGVGLEKVVPGGIPRDKVTVLFGETGTFKTTLKSNIIDAIARSGEGLVLDFTLEDSARLTRQRALARATGVPYSAFATRKFTTEHLEQIRNADRGALNAAKNVIVVDDVPPTANEIIRTARQYKRQGLVAVFVDYVTMLDWRGKSEREMLNDAMVKFQRAAKRDCVAFVVVSQLTSSRLHARERSDCRPELRDLFGSQSIANACKLAVATYRPSKYVPKPTGKDPYGEMYSISPEKYASVIELIVRKNVLGRSDVAVRVDCDASTGLMKPLEWNP